MNLNGNAFTDLSFLPPNLETISFSGSDVDPATIPPLASLADLSFAAANLDSFPDLSGFPSLLRLDLRYNNLTSLIGLTDSAALGARSNHSILVDHNLVDEFSCIYITAMLARTDLSGATFIYNPQGNFTLFFPLLPDWSQDQTGVLLDWIRMLNEDTLGSDINCNQ